MPLSITTVCRKDEARMLSKCFLVPIHFESEWTQGNTYWQEIFHKPIAFAAVAWFAVWVSTQILEQRSVTEGDGPFIYDFPILRKAGMSLLVHFLPCGLLCPHCITLFASLPCESNADDRTLEVIRNPCYASCHLRRYVWSEVSGRSCTQQKKMELMETAHPKLFD